MTAGMSVTDIAASISLDYASFMQGMKMVEQRFVDFSKSTASPFYPGSAPDQGGAHIQAFIDEQIKADGRMTALIIANRQRVHQFDQEAHAYRIRAAKETADLEKRISDAKLLESQRVAEMHKYEQQQRRQEADDRMEASNAIRRRMERDAELQSSISEIFGRQNQRLEDQAHKGDYLYALNKRQTQERKALLSVIADIVHHEKMLGTFDAERAKVLKEITASFKILQQQEQEAVADGIKTDTQERAQRAANERLDTERKIEAVLNRQAAQYDEVYAFELKQRAARSEFARLLLQAKSQGVSNENLMGAATQFREAQTREKEAFNASRIAKENAANAEELANWKQQDAHVQALRLNQMEQEQNLQKRGAALIKSLATAQDLHNERVQEYGHMLRANIITQKQYTQAVAQSNMIMNASNMGAGRFSGAMTQLSFAAEDFIQVTAMGGGLNMALMSASNNMSMFVRSMLPATGLLSGIAGAIVPLAAIGIGMYITKVMMAKDVTEDLNKELERLLRNAQQDIRLRSLYAFEDVQNISSAAAAISRAAEASKELKKAQLEQKLAQNAANSSLETLIMSLEEARKLTDVPFASDEFEYYQMAFKEYERAFEQVMNAGIKTEQDARTALSRYLASISEFPNVFTDQISIIQKILSDPEGSALEAFRQLEEQNARAFDAQQQMEEARKRALELSREELRVRQEEEYLLLRMSEEERARYDMEQQRKRFIGFDPGVAIALGNPMAAAQGAAMGMLFLQAQAAKIEKEIADMQQASSPEVMGGMQQNAAQAQADAFKQIFAAANKQPNPQLNRQIQLLEDIKEAMKKGGVMFQVVGQ